MSEILDRTLPDWKDAGWIYNVFYGSPYLCLGDDVSIDILLDATASAIQIFRAENSELYVFHDGFAAGWRITSKRIRSFQFSDADEIGKIIPGEIYFRDKDGYSDNYNIIDATGDWMITFCHEKDWFAFHRSQDAIDRLGATLKPGRVTRARRSSG